MLVLIGIFKWAVESYTQLCREHNAYLGESVFKSLVSGFERVALVFKLLDYFITVKRFCCFGKFFSWFHSKYELLFKINGVKLKLINSQSKNSEGFDMVNAFCALTLYSSS